MKTAYRLTYYVGLLLLVSLTTTPLRAQARLRTPEMYVGVQGGVLASTCQFSPAVPDMTPFLQGVSLSGNGGLVFRYAGHKVCGLQVELNYMQRCWQEKSDTRCYQRQLHYIELPLLTHLYFGSSSFRGFVNIGPQIGYCVYDDLGTGQRSTLAVHQYEPIDQPFDWGVAGGLGCYFRSQKAGIYQLEARFNYSLGTIFASRTTDYFNNANPMNLSLNLAWMWELKKTTKNKSN